MIEIKASEYHVISKELLEADIEMYKKSLEICAEINCAKERRLQDATESDLSLFIRLLGQFAS